VNENPWCRLPASPPYVLRDDGPLVRAFNKTAGPDHFLHVDEILPEPFVYAPDAPVVLLSNNPGFGEATAHKQDRGFMNRMRKNLLHERSDHPFVYLAPDISEALKSWWERKLKHLLKRFAPEVVARSILNVVYFPYASRKYRHGRLRLPSQDYSFRLVREAVHRGAFVVFMRKNLRWLNAVRELEGYDHRCQVQNTQNPAISPGNCSEFEKVVQAIKAAKRKRQA